MPKASSFSQFFRPQLSLRTLLLLMAVCAIALTAYRCPWVKETQLTWPTTSILDGVDGRSDDNIEMRDGKLLAVWEEPGSWIYDSATTSLPYRKTSTFRYGWNFTPLKHGVEEIHEDVGTEHPLVLRREYWDGDLRTLTTFSGYGKVTHCEHRLNGKAHGRFEGAQSWYEHAAGEYEHGKKVGIWTATYDVRHGDNAETMELQQSFDKGVLHGDWIWKSPTGLVLQTATFEHGRFAKWNGKPTQEALEELWNQCALSSGARKILQQNGAPLFDVSQRTGEFEFFGLRRDVTMEWAALHPLKCRFVTLGRRQTIDYASVTHLEAGERFLLMSLFGGQTLTVRYSQLCVVPICSREILHWDLTNVAAIDFAGGSPQQQAWQETVNPDLIYHDTIEGACLALFGGTPIQVEVKKEPVREIDTFIAADWPERLSRLKSGVGEPRARRDLFGLLLHLNGWTCQQQGDTLIVTDMPRS